MPDYNIKLSRIIAMIAYAYDPSVVTNILGPPWPLDVSPILNTYGFNINGGQKLVTAATEGFGTNNLDFGPTTYPLDTYFPPMMVDPFNFSVQLFNGTDPIDSAGQGGGGEIRLVDPRGDLDSIRNLSWDGRRIELRRFVRGAAWDTNELIAVMTTNGLRWDHESKSILLRDGQERLYGTVLLASFYSGSGGINGDTSLAGRPKPQSYGVVFNVEPILIDATNRVYQWHDRAVESTDEVRDGGSAYTIIGDYADYAALVAASLTTGQVATCNALGIFRLNNVPAYGLRVDGKGDKFGGVYVNKRGDILRRIATTRGGIPFADPSEIDTSSFTTMNTDQPYPVGFHFNSQLRIGEAFDVIMKGCAGYWYVTIAGLLCCGAWKAPAVSADVSFTYPDDLLPGLVPQMIEMAVPRVATRIGWKYNNSPQTLSELTGQGAANQRLYQELWSFADAMTETVRSSNPKAREVFVEGFFALQADAYTEASRQQTLLNGKLELWRWPVKVDPFQNLLGLTVGIKNYPRYGFGSERLFRCCGYEAAAYGLGAVMRLLG